jgi:hypothetical protein
MNYNVHETNAYVFISCCLWQAFRLIDISSGKHAEHTDTLCRQNAEVLIIKTGGAYSYQLALKF